MEAKPKKSGSLKLKGKALPVSGKVVKKKTGGTGSAAPADIAAKLGLEATTSKPKTDAEMKFDLQRKRRLEKHAEELAKLSYRERLEKENIKLSKKTELNDIPKVTYRTNK